MQLGRVLLESKVPFVVVNYNTSEEILRFVEQFCESKYQYHKGFYIVIVENTKVNCPRLQELAESCPERVMYVSKNENLGYLQGLLFGLNEAKTKWRGLEHCIFCNSDISFSSEDALIWAQKQTLSGRCLVGPSLVRESDKANQNPLYKTRPSRLKIRLLILVYSAAVLALLHGGAHKLRKSLFKAQNKAEVTAEEQVYAIHGAFMFLSVKFLEAVSACDWPCFLFSEELFLSELALDSGRQVMLDRTLLVTHAEHVSTGRLSSNASMRWRVESLRYCLNRFWCA